MSQQRHDADAVRQHVVRLPGQLARAEETPEEALDRMQREFDERTGRQTANMKACHAEKIFSGDQLVPEHYVGSTKTTRGAYQNRCQYCNAIRFPMEKETICCQKGKVTLPAVPQPTPILKRLLEGQDPRSNVFRKHIIPINNALAMASIKVQYKKQPVGNYKPQVMIQGKAYYYIGPLQVEEGQAPKFASLYVHDPTLKGTARKNNLYLPKDTSRAKPLRIFDGRSLHINTSVTLTN